MIKSTILTPKAHEVIRKKLEGKKLTQQDSNYLSRFVRPKLREMSKIDAKSLLKKLDYSPKSRAVERKIKEIVLSIISDVECIIICGSAIQTNYEEYADIDIIIATKKIIPNMKKSALVQELIRKGSERDLNLDPQVYAKRSIISQYGSSPSLIYQLKDSKVIYGNISLPKRISLSPLDLKIKLDWSEGLSLKSEASEIYYSIRNALLVLLLLNRKVDNHKLVESMVSLLGASLLNKLRSNTADKGEKKLALSHLNLLTNHLEHELGNPQWEKIELENH